MAPRSVRTSGRPNRRKLTRAATGFPGSAKTGMLSTTPLPMGFPGRSASFSVLQQPPAARIAGSRWSASLPATPPEVIRRSRCDAASCSVRAMLPRSSAMIPRSTTSMAGEPRSASNIGRLVSMMAIGAVLTAGSTSSSPVDRTPTRSRRFTEMRAFPDAAKMARCLASSTVPLGTIIVPDDTSSPRPLMLARYFRHEVQGYIGCRSGRAFLQNDGGDPIRNSRSRQNPEGLPRLQFR